MHWRMINIKYNYKYFSNREMSIESKKLYLHLSKPWNEINMMDYDLQIF